MARKLRVRAGDVFSIEVDGSRRAYGQVVLKSHASFPLYVCIFRPSFDKLTAPDIDAICEAEIALVGGTTDARLYHGMWTIVGNRTPNLERVPRPYFTVGSGGRQVLEDFDGRILREATPQEVTLYGNRWTRAPIAFENAIQALNGAGEWRADFDRLTIAHSQERAQL